MKVRSALLALAATSLLLVAGCSSDGSDGGSDSTDEVTTSAPAGDGDTAAPSGEGAELSAGIQEGLGLPADQADCMAEELTGAGLSEAGLQAIADANQEDLSSEDADAVSKAMQEALAAC